MASGVDVVAGASASAGANSRGTGIPVVRYYIEARSASRESARDDVQALAKVVVEEVLVMA